MCSSYLVAVSGMLLLLQEMVRGYCRSLPVSRPLNLSEMYVHYL